MLEILFENRNHWLVHKNNVKKQKRLFYQIVGVLEHGCYQLQSWPGNLGSHGGPQMSRGNAPVMIMAQIWIRKWDRKN